MIIKSIEINNFRSITKKSVIELGEYTVLVGKNNEGKSNVLDALNICLETLNRASKNRIFRNTLLKSTERGIFNWDEDFPKKLQQTRKSTIFRMLFVFSNDEREKLIKNSKIKNNGEMSIELKFKNDSNVEIRALKRGTVAYKTNDNLTKLLNFINDSVQFDYIGTHRNESLLNDYIYKIVKEKVDDNWNAKIQSLVDELLEKASIELNNNLNGFKEIYDIYQNVSIVNTNDFLRFVKIILL